MINDPADYATHAFVPVFFKLLVWRNIYPVHLYAFGHKGFGKKKGTLDQVLNLAESPLVNTVISFICCIC